MVNALVDSEDRSWSRAVSKGQGGFHTAVDVPHSCRPQPCRTGIGGVPMHLGLLAGGQLGLEWPWALTRIWTPLAGILDHGTRI